MASPYDNEEKGLHESIAPIAAESTQHLRVSQSPQPTDGSPPERPSVARTWSRSMSNYMKRRIDELTTGETADDLISPRHDQDDDPKSPQHHVEPVDHSGPSSSTNHQQHRNPYDGLTADETAARRLKVFRHITGIDTVEGDNVHKPRNVGIYRRVLREETKSLAQYNFYKRLITTALGLQLVVAAALTALGAGDGPHAIVTVFGAINTVIAGFLTYLKGSGVPNRLKWYAGEWGKLRQFIEQRERDLQDPESGIDVEATLRYIEKLYLEIRQDVAINEPEAYVSVSQIKSQPGLPGPIMMDPTAASNAAVKQAQEQETAMEKKLAALMDGVDVQIPGHREAIDANVRSARGVADQGARAAERAAAEGTHTVRNLVSQAQHALHLGSEKVDAAKRAATDAERDVQEAGSQGIRGPMHQAEQALHLASERVDAAKNAAAATERGVSETVRREEGEARARAARALTPEIREPSPPRSF